MRRARSIIVTLVIFAIIASSSTISIRAMGFTDITSSMSNDYIDAANYVSDHDYMDGIGSNLFGPNYAMTRAMVVQVLYKRSLGLIPATTSISFSDVPAGAWYYQAVKWAVANGIASGTSASTFSPNDSVKRQDAVLMLYKFTDKLGLSISGSASLTGYTDSGEISNYALQAMKWGVYHTLISGTSSNTLSPKASTTRIAFAIMIKKFGTNIEKLLYSHDVWQFDNSCGAGEAFNPNYYYITSTHYNKLKNMIDANYSTNKATYVKNCIYAMRYNTENGLANPWGGSCYGMSACVVLDKMGKIDFRRNFAATKANMHAITANDIRGKNAESAINFYQFSQFAFDGQRWDTTNTIATQIINTYNSILNSKGLGLLNVWWNETASNGDIVSYGHTVAVTSVTKTNNTYKFKVYDPNVNGATTDTLLTVQSNGYATLPTSGIANQLTHIGVVSNLNDYSRKVDIDGYQNSLGNSASYSFYGGTPSILEDDNYASIIIQLTSSFEVSFNDRVIKWDGESILGDTDGISYYFINNYNGPGYINISVPLSEQYRLTEDGKTMQAIIIDARGFSYINGKGIEKATIDSEKSIKISGNAPECLISINRDRKIDQPSFIRCSGEKEINVKNVGSALIPDQDVQVKEVLEYSEENDGLSHIDVKEYLER